MALTDDLPGRRQTEHHRRGDANADRKRRTRASPASGRARPARRWRASPSAAAGRPAPCPAADPRKASNRLSVKSCRSSRARPAPDRGADRQLAFARDATRQQQAAEVRAGHREDQQHQRADDADDGQRLVRARRTRFRAGEPPPILRVATRRAQQRLVLPDVGRVLRSATSPPATAVPASTMFGRGPWPHAAPHLHAAIGRTGWSAAGCRRRSTAARAASSTDPGCSSSAR